MLKVWKYLEIKHSEFPDFSDFRSVSEKCLKPILIDQKLKDLSKGVLKSYF